MRSLIIGATGFIGKALVKNLENPVVSGRNKEKLIKLFPRHEAREWLTEGAPPTGFLDDIDTIYHLAGESVYHGRWNKSKKKRIRNSRVISTRNLVQAVANLKRKPATLVSGSAVGYYANRGDEILTEESAPGVDFLARVCQEWELEALKAKEHGVRVVLIRTGVVLGKNGGALSQMLPIFKAGLGGRLGNGRQFMPWIHINDMVKTLLFAKENDELSGPVNAVAPTSLTNSQFTKALSLSLNRPATLPAPAFALKLFLGEFANSLLASRNIKPEVLEKAGFSFDFPSINKALADLLH